MSKRHNEKDLSLQLDSAEDDEIEILEVIGLEEHSPRAGEGVVPAPEEIEVRFEDAGGEEVARSAGRPWGAEEEALDGERFLRLRADFENFKKRVEREREATERQAGARLLRRLLPILDNFERAVSAEPGAQPDSDSFRDGVVLIFRQLLEELRKAGLTSIDAIGQPFDPHLHDAVATESDSGLPSHTIVEELQRGYQLDGRVLRPSLVKVAIDDSDVAASGIPTEES